jgi:hypothetical protein
MEHTVLILYEEYDIMSKQCKRYMKYKKNKNAIKTESHNAPCLRKAM